ncbi:hypothetical protein GCM10027579_13500 [Calidifontibacter terrae]
MRDTGGFDDAKASPAELVDEADPAGDKLPEPAPEAAVEPPPPQPASSTAAAPPIHAIRTRLFLLITCDSSSCLSPAGHLRRKYIAPPLLA